MASSQKVKSGTEQQVELLIELKEKVDLVYKQLNQYRGACRSVDRLNRAVRRTGGQLDPDRMSAEFVKFERDYRVSRKRLRKLDRQLLAFNLYDKLYDLYESLVMGESIGTGGDLIDPSAIDKAIVVGCNGPVGIEDNSGNDIASTERPFQCPQCDKSFITSSDLTRHKRTHESEPRFKCSLDGCDFGTFRSDQFNVHQAVHTGKHRFKCSWKGCDFGTNYSQSLKDHQAVHTGELPFQCPQCDKSFKTSSHLTRHKRTHESEPRFKCSWDGCDFGTNYSQSLKDHQAVHTGELPFQCPQCDKSFKTSNVLSRHKRTHESEPRFKCSWVGCDYGTNFNEHFKSHETVHSDERPFHCPLCDKSFKKSCDLTRHKRTHESEPRFKCSWEGCDYGSHYLVGLTKHQNRHMANQN